MNTKRDTASSVESDSVCASLGNKQRAVATTDAKLKFQRFDDDGTITTDARTDQLSVDWNTNTNKATITVPKKLCVAESLTIAGTSVMTELNAIKSERDYKVDDFLVNAPLAWELDPQNPLVTKLGIISGSYATPTYVNTELSSKQIRRTQIHNY